jgi:hypothetical protein
MSAAKSDQPKGPSKTADFVRFEGERWLAKKLGMGGVLSNSLFAGDTNTDSRRERLRAAIRLRGPDSICGTRHGMQITFRSAFEQLYGEPLDPVAGA